MSPPRRRSKRLASATTPKPKAVSNLSALTEREETPDEGKAAESLDALVDSPQQRPTTPASSALKPPMTEMHPSKAHHAISGPSEAWLGFRDVKSADHSRGKTAATAPQTTPSKANGVPSAPFTFNIGHPGGDTGLSSAAQRMMQDLREDTARIKAELLAKREEEKQQELVNGRKIAKARGKSGRFSAAHMNAFKKMDSIEGHASAFRAQPGRLTPGKSALKRSPSKAQLDDNGTPTSELKRTHSKAGLNDTPSQPKLGLKRTSSKANLDDRNNTPSSARRLFNAPSAKLASAPAPESPSPVKRVRHQLEDDAASHRPVSRDNSSIPRPKSSGHDSTGLPRSQSGLASHMSSTKVSSRKADSQIPDYPSLVKSPSSSSVGGLPKSPTKSAKSELGALGGTPSQGNIGTMNKSATASKLASSKAADLKRRIVSPGRFEKVKSILRGKRTVSNNPKTAIPGPFAGASQTPGPQIVEKSLPAVPFTTPRRKLFKHVEFTPDTKGQSDVGDREVHYPNLDAVLGRIPQEPSPGAASPSHRPLPEPPKKADKDNETLPPAVPGTFTFRSGPTIKFNSPSSRGFGSSPGQSTIRPVRPSLPLKDLPGSFPGGSELPQSEDVKGKETESGAAFVGIPHGMANEKRARTDANNHNSHMDKENESPRKFKFAGVAHGLTNEKRARSRDAEASSHPDKENRSPAKLLAGYAHGMANKKRARASQDESDEEVDREGAERGGKKRKAGHVGGGPTAAPAPAAAAAVTTPKVTMRATSSASAMKRRAGSATPSPVKKSGGMSLSRLNMLAQPKRR